MKKIIRSLFWRSDDDRFSFDDGRKSCFRLLYGNLLVGELSFFDGKWHFSYSAEFIRQNTILPLVNFPTKDKVYVSETKDSAGPHRRKRALKRIPHAPGDLCALFQCAVRFFRRII